MFKCFTWNLGHRLKKIPSQMKAVVKKRWYDWLRGKDLNLRPSGYEPDVSTFLPIKITQHIKKAR